MVLAIRFILGLVFGSFLNVIALRYDPDRFIFAPGLRGRSHCPHCQRTLRWFELVPVLSFIFLRARCRTCRGKISWQYPAVEILSGLIFILPVFRPVGIAANPVLSILWAAVWIAVFWFLLLMAAIDIRLRIIPDEIHIVLAALGVLRIFAAAPDFAAGGDSFLGGYALLFGLRQNIWLNHLAAALFAGLFLLLLVLITRGRGMGGGDVKLAAALGFLFGWPDAALVIVLAFVSGAIYGILLILFGRKRFKSAVPFGPFLALGALVLILFGNVILSWYFGLFGIIPR